jgi:hypothetical protein
MIRNLFFLSHLIGLFSCNLIRNSETSYFNQYEKYSVYLINPETEEHIQNLRFIQINYQKSVRKIF